MDWIPAVVSLVAGFILGIGAAFLLRIVQAKTARELAFELFRESEAQRKAHVDAVVENVKATFGSLSLDALARSHHRPGDHGNRPRRCCHRRGHGDHHGLTRASHATADRYIRQVWAGPR